MAKVKSIVAPIPQAAVRANAGVRIGVAENGCVPIERPFCRIGIDTSHACCAQVRGPYIPLVIECEQQIETSCYVDNFPIAVIISDEAAVVEGVEIAVAVEVAGTVFGDGYFADDEWKDKTRVEGFAAVAVGRGGFSGSDEDGISLLQHPLKNIGAGSIAAHGIGGGISLDVGIGDGAGAGPVCH